MLAATPGVMSVFKVERNRKRERGQASGFYILLSGKQSDPLRTDPRRLLLSTHWTELGHMVVLSCKEGSEMSKLIPPGPMPF